MQLLIDYGANSTEDDSDLNGHTPLMTACDHGHRDSVLFLLEHFVKLTTGKQQQQQQSTQNLLADQVNRRCQKYHSWTPLHFAANYGNAAICQELLDRGAFVDALDNIGRTPLHHASSKGHFDTVLLLVERGANVDIRDDGAPPSKQQPTKDTTKEEQQVGKTPLDLAVDSIFYHKVAKAFRDGMAKRTGQNVTPVRQQQQQRDGSSSSPVHRRTSSNTIFALDLERKKRDARLSDFISHPLLAPIAGGQQTSNEDKQ